MKALVTGSEGFVGKYLRAELEEAGYQTAGLDCVAGVNVYCCDLNDSEKLRGILREFRPDAVFHLAGQADVGKSWREPAATFLINTVGAANLLEAVRLEQPEAGVLLVGSSDQYGRLGSYMGRVSEDMETRPQSPYAVSKKAQEELGMLYAKSYGMRVIATRSFNHSGAGQRRGFMISDFAAGIVQVERGEADCLRVGNLDASRDFTHVTDVVRAYRLLMEKGRSGEVYNVGTGTAWQAREILEMLRKMARVEVPVRQDPARMRPSDTPVICCDRSKLTKDTGWEPRKTIGDLLRDTLEDYRKQAQNPSTLNP